MTRNRWGWVEWLVIAAMVLLGVSIAAILCWWRVGFTMVMTAVLLVLGTLAYQIVRAAVWRRRLSKAQYVVRAVLVGPVAIMFIAAMLLAIRLTVNENRPPRSGPPSESDMRRLVPNSPEVDTLQNWAITYLKASRPPCGYTGDLHGFPEFIREMHPRLISFTKGGPDGDCVELMWGGHFGTWGITLGTSSFRDQSFGQSGDLHRTVLRWRDGVYGFEAND